LNDSKGSTVTENLSRQIQISLPSAKSASDIRLTMRLRSAAAGSTT
jgi:hypothetical protein